MINNKVHWVLSLLLLYAAVVLVWAVASGAAVA